MGYFAQHAMDLLDGERTVFESLEESFPQAGQGSLRTLAGCFGFSGDDVEKKCRVLSGGEKARLVMAKMLFDPPNFLVLDEPTNHLDMATKEMLITALSQFEGTMLFVSHDRHFLAALSNRVLELTPEGIHQYGGGYTEYVARTGHEAPGLRRLMQRRIVGALRAICLLAENVGILGRQFLMCWRPELVGFLTHRRVRILGRHPRLNLASR